jgi:glycosyltransferase involved in cell wall biosynthesis
MIASPHVSVIIPTYNRSVALQRTLDALCAQTYPAQHIEVLVVADGCSDGTLRMLEYYEAPFRLRAIGQPNQGPAGARNHGAAQASGQLLVFLDDDIEATPSLIAAHVRAHAAETNRVILGYLPPVIDPSVTGFFRMELRDWWENMFRSMRQPGYRFGYWNLLSGHFSVTRELFSRVGGFDAGLRCHEDYELGIRLIHAGASMGYAADAVGYHHEGTDLARSLRRKYQEGRADVMIGRRYPELRAVLPLARFEKTLSRRNRNLRTLAFGRPAKGDKMAARFQRALDRMEWMRLRRRWHDLLDELLDYWYWRGVADELGARDELIDFLQGGPAQPDVGGDEIELDLSKGLGAAERQLDKKKPAGVWIHCGEYPIGHIPPRPGAEPLCGRHLRPRLMTDLAWPLLMSLAIEESVGGGDTPLHRRFAGSARQSEGNARGMRWSTINCLRCSGDSTNLSGSEDK